MWSECTLCILYGMCLLVVDGFGVVQKQSRGSPPSLSGLVKWWSLSVSVV